MKIGPDSFRKLMKIRYILVIFVIRNSQVREAKVASEISGLKILIYKVMVASEITGKEPDREKSKDVKNNYHLNLSIMNKREIFDE